MRPFRRRRGSTALAITSRQVSLDHERHGAEDINQRIKGRKSNKEGFTHRCLFSSYERIRCFEGRIVRLSVPALSRNAGTQYWCTCTEKWWTQPGNYRTKSIFKDFSAHVHHTSVRVPHWYE